jgi:hypothetical protein
VDRVGFRREVLWQRYAEQAKAALWREAGLADG